MKPEVTFAFKGDKAFAIREGKVIAQSHVDNLGDLEKVAFGHDPMGGQPPMGDPHAIDGPTEMPPPPGDMQDPYLGGDEPCPQCGQPNEAGSPVCVGCGAPLGDPHGGMESQYPEDHPSPGIEMGGEAGPYMASITTPNGLKGKVLGKVAGVWQDEVTVRLENGRIVHLPVSKDMKFERTASVKASNNPADVLEARLSSLGSGGLRDELEAQRAELADISKTARTVIAEGVSDDTAEALDNLVVTAEVTMTEVDEAIAHLDDEETTAYAPPAPFSIGAAHQAAASLGGKDGSWLDKTANEMIAEAESTDFKRLMDEGPEALTAELEAPALADAGVVRQMAASFIRTKTAGTDPQVRDPYERTFLDRVEQCRRAALAARKQATHKEAAAQEDAFKDAPDESIFM